MNILFIIASSVLAQQPGETCDIRQHCIRTEEQKDDPCPNPKNTLNPEIGFFTPQNLSSQDVKDAFYKICPFIDADQPLCCNDD